MTEELTELKEIQTRRRANKAASGILLLGLGLVLVLIGFMVRGQQVNTAAINELQGALKYTCDVAKQSSPPLPAAVNSNCEIAKQNRVVDYIQGVDNPDPNDPESQDEEIQQSEIQEPEIQDSELQDPESQDPEAQESELQDPEGEDPELDEPEIQEGEVQEEEIQEPEIQESEEQNAPVCREGYTATDVQWYGPDGLPDNEDDQVWSVCVKDGS